MTDFTHLHCHSSFSMLDGAVLPEQMVARLLELGHASCAVTDHGNLYAHRSFDRVMRAAGLKPIFGLEAYQVAALRDESIDVTTGKKTKVTDDEKLRNHVTLLACSERGYVNLLELNKIAYDNFYYKPVLTWDSIARHQEGLIVLSGCAAGDLSRKIIAGQENEAFSLMRWCQQNIQNYYAEIIPCPSLDFSVPAVRKTRLMARELGVPVVLTNDAHFATPSDHELEDLLVCIGLKKTVNDPSRTLRLPEYHHICDSQDLLKRAEECIPQSSSYERKSWLDHTSLIASQIDFELPVAKKATFPVAKPEQTSLQALQSLIKKGKKTRFRQFGAEYFTEDKMQVYEDRLDYELGVIASKQFEDYFLIVADIVQYVKSQNQICAARGSAAGSLICWLLEITQIDPVEFDLPFERFMNPDRADYPDIDLDFPNDFRAQVFHYLTAKYGEDYVGHVGAISYFRANQAILDVGKAYEVPYPIMQQLSAGIPTGPDADGKVKNTGVLKKYFAETESIQWILKRYPKLHMAEQVEGQVRHSTIHAAGFVVAGEPISTICGVGQRKGELPIIQADKEEVAAAGLLKIDVLSLDTLGVIGECIKQLGFSFDDVLRWPLDDEAVYDMFSRGEATGIFQIQGGAATMLLKQMRPKDIHDVAAISVLARPGPLKSGGAAAYVEGYNGRAVLPTLHPLLAAVVAPTFGQIIYQEQVMAVAREIGGFSWGDVHKIRKMITSTSYGSADVQKYYEGYTAGAEERGVPKSEYDWAWNQCEKAGGYVFNKAHAYSYAMIGYWTAYIKRHYPAVFTAIACSHTDDETTKIKLLSEFRKSGGKIQLLDHSQSGLGFKALDDKTLVGGFDGIAGIGPAIAQTLMASQPYRDWDHFYEVCPKALGAKLQSTRVHEPDGALHDGAVGLLAPWFVETRFDPELLEFFRLMHVSTVEEVEAMMQIGRGGDEVRVAGKVVKIELVDRAKMALKYGGDPPAAGEPKFSARVTIVDDTGSMMINYSPRGWDEMVRERDPLQGAKKNGVGNTVMLTGTISRDCARVFGSDFLVVEALEAPETHRDIPTKRAKKETRRESTIRTDASTRVEILTA